MLRKFIQVTDGYITGTCECDMAADATPTAGLIEVPADTDLAASVHCAYDEQTAVIGGLRPSPPVRLIPLGDWMDRWTDAEQLALEAISEAQTDAGRAVRVLTRRLMAAGALVDLDDPQMAARLAQLAPILIAATVWADEAAASARIAALLTDG